MPITNRIIIRDSKAEDFEGVLSLLKQLWPGSQINSPAIQESFLKTLEVTGHIIRVACTPEKVVGLCSLSIRNNLKAEGNLANIDELVVDETMRRQQIGKLLLEDAEAIAKQNGCKSLGLESSFHREEAHRFYIKNGYGKQGYYIIRKLE
ncbi:GNAT family N-acetyltransferase [Daejeonella sp.]|uniref:GNAT family N-acetyltransferase n=1 Tax=Daejeonella sp. TaxID=2805397 RepID=UPI003983311D